MERGVAPRGVLYGAKEQFLKADVGTVAGLCKIFPTDSIRSATEVLGHAKSLCAGP